MEQQADREYLIGAKGGQELRTLLSTRDPLSVVQLFHSSYGLEQADAEDLCRFLDLLGVRRRDVYRSILKNLRQKVLEALPSLSSNQYLIESFFC